MDAHDTVRHLYHLIDAGNFTEFVALFDGDAVYQRPGCETLAGRDAIEHFYRECRTIRDGTHTLSRILVDSQRIAVDGGFSGTLTDGRKAEHRFAEFFELSDEGLITRRDSFLFVSYF